MSGWAFPDRVYWPGMLRGNLKWGSFYSCEAFILPSHQENFGIAVAEALACGKPVLLSNKVNIAAEIERDGVGLWSPTPPKAHCGCCSVGSRCLPPNAKRWADRRLETFRTRYDMKENAKTIIRLFETAMKEMKLTPVK